MTPIVLDLIIVAVLALFGFLGWRKGLILSLCGLLAFFVAFFGANFVSRTFSEPVCGIIQPIIQNELEEILEDSLHLSSSSSAAPSIALPGSSAVKEDPVDQISLADALDVLSQSALFVGLHDTLEQGVREGAVKVATTAAAAISNYLALQIAQSILFFLTFVLIQAAWWLLSRALDLAFQLPGLRTLNGVGGMILGLVKGVLVLIIVIWFLTLMDIVPPETVEQTYIFQLLNNFQLM